MFKNTVVASVGLPKGVWEPLRVLCDEQGVRLPALAKAWGIPERDMLKVLLAARLRRLSQPEDVGLEIVDRGF